MESRDWSSDVCSSDLFPSHDTRFPVCFFPRFHSDSLFNRSAKLNALLISRPSKGRLEAMGVLKAPVSNRYDIQPLIHYHISGSNSIKISSGVKKSEIEKNHNCLGSRPSTNDGKAVVTCIHTHMLNSFLILLPFRLDLSYRILFCFFFLRLLVCHV